MKRFVKRYRDSKFKCFTNGLLFAMIAMISLALCLISLSNSDIIQARAILHFCIALLSMLIGFYTILRNNKTPKRKEPNRI